MESFLFVIGKHPRLRGEDLPKKDPAPAEVGNTPAYAGKTLHTKQGDGKGQKHPRLRGEDSNILCKNIR